jgi:hypothetical protein
LRYEAAVNSRPTNVWAALKEQLIKPGGLALAFTGLALGLVAYFVLPDWKISAQAILAVIIVAVASIWVCLTALNDALACTMDLSGRLDEAVAGVRYAPKVLHAMSDPSDEGTLLLLIEANRLFGQSMLVSLYYEDERGFELLVGAGKVANVQTNGMIQISVTAWQEAHLAVRRWLVGQESGKIERLLVRPAPTT